MSADDLQGEIQKRLTMNWLIQSASQHVGMTLHHLIKDQLTAIHPKLPLWYDQLALMNQLQWWRPVPTLMFGWPTVNWRSASWSRRHPFFGHPLLAPYGGAMAEASRRRAAERARVKNVWRLPATFTVHNALLLERIRRAEKRCPGLVEGAACQAASLAWGIEPARFDATLAASASPLAPFAALRPSRSIRAGLFLAGAVGWGGVTRSRDGSLRVRAQARNGYYLCKELVKGTAELICLHGLARLSEPHYQHVMEATERIELEPAMLQSGGEVWRRLLHALPPHVGPADFLMRLARSSNEVIVDVLRDVVEESRDAPERIRLLCDAA